MVHFYVSLTTLTAVEGLWESGTILICQLLELRERVAVSTGTEVQV